MLTKFRLVIQTVIHLRSTQIIYQVYYKLRNRFISAQHYGNLTGYQEPPTDLKFSEYVPDTFTYDIYLEDEDVKFEFLHLKNDFRKGAIDWEFEGHGKLWNYNLNYFEFLFSKNLTTEQGVDLIREYCSRFQELKGGLEPYPISLRGINWIKFLINAKINDPEINKSLYCQYKVLLANLEYHLLANHLLENGFSLLFAAYYFRDQKFYRKARKILFAELDEQLLGDAGHFERSAMYHQILLHRLLDCINLVSHNPWNGDEELLGFLKDKAERMLQWLKAVTFSNGEIPIVKDAAQNIAPSTASLISYAASLNLNTKADPCQLAGSGYRMLEQGNFEVFFDIGSVMPSYQPGHAHADMLSFVLYINSRPVIVDTGVSTYNICERRNLERSTPSHNTVSINQRDSIGVWSGFRVAKRAKVSIMKDSPDQVMAGHNGYRAHGVMIRRSISVSADQVLIEDFLDSAGDNLHNPELNLHFHPDCEVELIDDVIVAGGSQIRFVGFQEIHLKNYMFAQGFNLLRKATRVSLKPSKESQIFIKNVD